MLPIHIDSVNHPWNCYQWAFRKIIRYVNKIVYDQSTNTFNLILSAPSAPLSPNTHYCLSETIKLINVSSNSEQ